MNKRIAALLLIFGALLVVLGFVFRGTDVHAAGTTGYLTCGTVAAPDTLTASRAGIRSDLAGLSLSADHQNIGACEEALSTRSTWTWVMIGAGAVFALGALFAFTYSPAGRRPAAA